MPLRCRDAIADFRRLFHWWRRRLLFFPDDILRRYAFFACAMSLIFRFFMAILITDIFRWCWLFFWCLLMRDDAAYFRWYLFVVAMLRRFIDIIDITILLIIISFLRLYFVRCFTFPSLIFFFYDDIYILSLRRFIYFRCLCRDTFILIFRHFSRFAFASDTRHFSYWLLFLSLRCLRLLSLYRYFLIDAFIFRLHFITRLFTPDYYTIFIFTFSFVIYCRFVDVISYFLFPYYLRLFIFHYLFHYLFRLFHDVILIIFHSFIFPMIIFFFDFSFLLSPPSFWCLTLLPCDDFSYYYYFIISFRWCHYLIATSSRYFDTLIYLPSSAFIIFLFSPIFRRFLYYCRRHYYHFFFHYCCDYLFIYWYFSFFFFFRFIISMIIFINITLLLFYILYYFLHLRYFINYRHYHFHYAFFMPSMPFHFHYYATPIISLFAIIIFAFDILLIYFHIFIFFLSSRLSLFFGYFSHADIAFITYYAHYFFHYISSFSSLSFSSLLFISLFIIIYFIIAFIIIFHYYARHNIYYYYLRHRHFLHIHIFCFFLLSLLLRH